MHEATIFRQPLFRVLIALMAIAMFSAACGSDGTSTAVADEVSASDSDAMDETSDDGAMDDHSTDGTMDDGAMDEDAMAGGHHHGEGLEVSADIPTPTLTLEVTEDPKSGWNVHAVPTGHALSPQNATTEHIDGEGHMHLYVDGERVTRLYSEWYHLASLDPGEHEVRVELSSNNHSAMTIDGAPIDQTVSITQQESGAAHHHGDSGGHETAGQALNPSVRIQILEDPKSGWAINAIPNEHEINPSAASTEHVDGEGHMHLYVDGERVGRLYGEWYYLAPLSAGDHEVRVELSGNDHQPLLSDGVIIDAMATVTQPEATAVNTGHGDTGHGDTDHGDTDGEAGADDGGHGHTMTEAASSDEVSTADTLITVDIAAGAPSGDTGRQEVAAGSTVAIVVSSDGADEVHVHGYDLLRPVDSGTDATFVFVADIPGLFEVELEGAGTLLIELLVS